ncbi:hypothetical protein [Streptomyces violaceusniger]|uniref:hypothetical protein n=1 Tax=Streptomyces violaceusniger TaxID=68280 RepID=UPI00381E48C7
MEESLFDRTTRAMGSVPLRYTDDGIPVHAGWPLNGELAEAALAVVRPELERLRKRVAELEGSRPQTVLPAKFVTDAMNRIPDSLPPDFQ